MLVHFVFCFSCDIRFTAAVFGVRPFVSALVGLNPTWVITMYTRFGQQCWDEKIIFSKYSISYFLQYFLSSISLERSGVFFSWIF